MRSDVDGPRFVAALQHRLDRRGERFRSDGAGEPLNPCEADAALSCRERLGPEHEERPLFGLTVVHDALPRLRVPREDVDVSQSPRLLDPRAVQCPVAPAGRDIEPWRSCLDALVPVPGLARRGLLDLDPGSRDVLEIPREGVGEFTESVGPKGFWRRKSLGAGARGASGAARSSRGLHRRPRDGQRRNRRVGRRPSHRTCACDTTGHCHWAG